MILYYYGLRITETVVALEQLLLPSISGLYVRDLAARYARPVVAPWTRRLSDKLKQANAARGMPISHTFEPKSEACNPAEDAKDLILELYASELRLRGDAPIVQPHVQGGDVLCWNGEVFEGLDIGSTENDGVKIFERFRSARTPRSIQELLGNIEGPLYFARDPLGRRSLLIHKPTFINPFFLLASVSAGDDPAYEFEELSTDGIFALDLTALCESDDVCNLILALCGTTILLKAEISKVNTTLPPVDLPIIQGLDPFSLPAPLSEAVEELISHLDTEHIPQTPSEKGKARVAVLFSGGIDSTMLTFLAHRHVPVDEPIDLLNVAFENPRKIQVQLDGNIGGLPKRERKRHLKAVEMNGKGADRITGLHEVEELRRLCPGRVWNFVEVDVPYEAMHPSRTVMDLSLAIALHFASRGIGRIRDSPTTDYSPYTSPARVLLNGLGSDELLGGYSRHRTAFKARGWQGVIDELQVEIDRIPTRNLGRDDRVISSHGKETRHPFLSLSVLDPRLEIGMGDKTLLRLAARKVGLVEASTRKKRAMQFGSHSARMEGGEGERKGYLIITSTLT
ncbi:asparagine synthase-domain-containing protein [Melanogaster broomeanus]|nr:asparagine synthase-domain-containing protein [Melanogaster broomeanus]